MSSEQLQLDAIKRQRELKQSEKLKTKQYYAKLSNRLNAGNSSVVSKQSVVCGSSSTVKQAITQPA